MRALLSQLILPLPVFWLMLLAGAILLYFKKKKAARYLAAAALIWLALVSTAPFTRLLVRSLERQYEPLLHPEIPPDAPAPYVMVLGGGHATDKRLPPTAQLAPLSLGRLVEGVRLHRLLPGSKLVLSGWGYEDEQSQAEVMAAAALTLGVAEADVIQLPEPHNTQAEAQAYYDAFGADRPLIIVTDAVHMPRAMFHFHRAGLQPTPAPVNQIYKQTDGPTRISLWPSAGYLNDMQRVAHEYAGMLWARIRG